MTTGERQQRPGTQRGTREGTDQHRGPRADTQQAGRGSTAGERRGELTVFQPKKRTQHALFKSNVYIIMTTGEEPDTQRPSGTADQQQTREGTDQHQGQRADTQSSRAADQPGGEELGREDSGDTALDGLDPAKYKKQSTN